MRTENKKQSNQLFIWTHTKWKRKNPAKCIFTSKFTVDKEGIYVYVYILKNMLKCSIPPFQQWTRINIEMLPNYNNGYAKKLFLNEQKWLLFSTCKKPYFIILFLSLKSSKTKTDGWVDRVRIVIPTTYDPIEWKAMTSWTTAVLVESTIDHCFALFCVH